MSQIIPFDFNQLPAHLRANTSINDEVLAHARLGGITVMSIKGSRFTISKGDEKTLVMNPKDPDSPASNIEVSIIRIQKGVSKTYYSKGYTDGADSVKPDCFSHDGITPDRSIDKPVCNSCTACPKNVFGSKVGDNGKKAKACSDTVRIAIAAPDSIEEPMLLRVPPASIKPLHEHVRFVAKKGVEYNKVVTKLSFDPDSPTPLLRFTPVGFVDAETAASINEAFDSDAVQNILGGMTFGTEHAEDPVVAKDEPAPTPAPEPVKAPRAPRAATKDKTVTEAEVVAAVASAVEPAAPKVTVAINPDEIDLDDLNFDD